MHNVLFILCYANVAGYFNNAEINNQLFYSIKLVNMSNFIKWYAKTDIIDNAIFCRIHEVCNIGYANI